MNVKEAILTAATNVGNKMAKRPRKDPNGLISYFEKVAVEQPRAYLSLLERIMRSQPDQAELPVPHQTVDELQKILRDRGLPIDRIYTTEFAPKKRDATR